MDLGFVDHTLLLTAAQRICHPGDQCGLAHLQLGRAYSLQGDTAKARVAYNDFLTLWKDANPDVPILKQAKQIREVEVVGLLPRGRIVGSRKFSWRVGVD